MEITAALSANSESLADEVALRVIAALRAQQPEIRNSIPRDKLQHYFDAWQADCAISLQSPATKRNRESVKDLLIWWLDQNHKRTCGPDELRGFMGYLTAPVLTVADDDGEHGRGRWGFEVAVRPQVGRTVCVLTVKSYHGIIRTWMNYLVDQDVLTISPLHKIKPPQDRGKRDRIQPYTNDQKSGIIRAAKRSSNPVRDEAIVKMLLSTGMRANELVMLDLMDVDLLMKRAKIRFAKGHLKGKERTVNFGRRTAMALYNYKAYSEKIHAPSNTPFFTSERGKGYGQRLTPGGLHQMIHRLVDDAGIADVERLVHSFRHTFAVDFLLAGGLASELQVILGHDDPEMTMRYVNFAEADIEASHLRHDPVDKLDKGL